MTRSLSWVDCHINHISWSWFQMNEYKWMMQCELTKMKASMDFPPSFRLSFLSYLVSFSSWSFLCICLNPQIYILTVSRSFIHSALYNVQPLLQQLTQSIIIPSESQVSADLTMAGMLPGVETARKRRVHHTNHGTVFGSSHSPSRQYSATPLSSLVRIHTINLSGLYSWAHPMQLGRDCNFAVYRFNSWDFKLLKQHIYHWWSDNKLYYWCLIVNYIRKMKEKMMRS